MKAAALLAFVLALPGAGCAMELQRQRAATAQPTGSVRTAEQAVEIVRRHIRDQDGDPNGEEITAEWSQGQWRVIAWRIVYPGNVGASRFVPGGRRDYRVSPDGRITLLMPGA